MADSLCKVLFVAPEAAPFVQVGGLGGVMSALPNWLKNLGFDVRVMLPRYGSIDTQKYNLEMVYEGLKVPTDAKIEGQPQHLICNIKQYSPENDNCQYSTVPTYFLENQEYYELRSNVYGYSDDAIRWALLSRGVLEFLRTWGGWLPDIIITADWQTGFLSNLLNTAYKDDQKLNTITTIFTIHNLYYQGMFDHRFVPEEEFDDGKSPLPSFFEERLLKCNMMQRGIMYSNLIITVSPTYAREIITPEYGELLDKVLRVRKNHLFGVINGIDYSIFNPATNPNLKKHYDCHKIEGRVINKLALQSRFDLKKDKKTFLVGIVSRLTEQKGFDLLFPVMDSLLHELNMQLLILGCGDSKYMGYFQDLKNRFPGKVGAHFVFDKNLPHFIFSGADAILIPSKFEPSGLIQMEAMHYGAVPIVRATGGLADTVEDYDELSQKGVGFTFKDFNPMSLVIAMVRAYENYHHPQVWQEIQKQGMSKDFSWKQSAIQYANLFKVAMSIKNKTKQH